MSGNSPKQENLRSQAERGSVDPFRNLATPKQALRQYGQEKYGQAANEAWEKRKGPLIAKAYKEADSQRGWGQRYFGLSNSQARDREVTAVESSFKNTFINESIRLAGQEKAPKNEKRVKTKSSGVSKGSSPKSEFPKASDAKQPQLEKPVNTESRITTIGESKTQLFDINSFRSEMLENDILPSHSYLVTFSQFRTGFPENAPLTDFVVNKRNTLMMRCENVVLPAPSLLEEENIRRYGYGPVEKVPYGVQFSDVTMTWLVDSKSEIIDFFHQWMNTIVMHDSPNALMRGTTTRDRLDKYLPFEVGYKDAYTCPIVRINVYNRQQATVTKYEMYDVFPMNIQSMNLTWADENQFQKLTVTFAYTNMQVSAPIKADPQLNYVEETGGASPYEEKIQPDDKGGKAARDQADSPTGESITSSSNSSNPTIQNAVYIVPAAKQTQSLITRDFST